MTTSAVEEGRAYSGVSVVIPAYNEEKRISPLLRDLTKNLKTIQNITVVIDGNDGTEAIVKSFGADINILKFGRKLGRGGAVLEGIKSTKSETVCFVDADGSAPWFELAKVASTVNSENRCSVGSRWVRGSVIHNHEPLLKTISGRLWHYITFLVLGIRTKDVQCGLKCFYGSLAREVANKVTTTNSLFDVALLYNIKRMGYNITEIGIEWSHKEGTKMSLTKNHVFLMFLGVLGIRLAHTNFYARHKKSLDPKARKVLRFINQFH